MVTFVQLVKCKNIKNLNKYIIDDPKILQNHIIKIYHLKTYKKLSKV